MKRLLIEPSTRIEGLEEYYFSTKLKQIREMNLTGETVINLGIGSPDQAPAEEAIEGQGMILDRNELLKQILDKKDK